MKFKKLLSTFLVSSFIISSVPITVSASTVLMEDAKNSWASNSIERWLIEGVVSGDTNGNFNPSKSLTRAEFAVILSNLLGLKEKSPNIYDDLDTDAWYSEAILKCTSAGIMYGSSEDGKLNSNPNATITRQEAMVMFGRAIGVQPDTNPDLSQFNDGYAVSDWAKGYISKMYSLGIISGMGNGILGSTLEIDRASTMAILDRAISHYITTTGTVNIDNPKGFVIVNIPNGNGNLVISGKAEGIVIAEGTVNVAISTENLATNSLKVDGSSKVTLSNGTNVNNLIANDNSNVVIGLNASSTNINAYDNAYVTILGKVNNVNASGSSIIENNSSISDIQINENATIKNNGKIENATINSENATINGNTPENMVNKKEPSSDSSSDNDNSSSGDSATKKTVYKVDMYFMGERASQTVDASSNFSSTLGSLIDSINISRAERKFDDIELALNNESTLRGWQKYYDKYNGIVSSAIANAGLSYSDKISADSLVVSLNPTRIKAGETSVHSLLNDIKELFSNVNDSNVGQFETLFNEFYNNDVKITVNEKPANPTKIAQLLHNAPLDDWYSYFESNKNENEIRIFFQFDNANPTVNGMDLGVFVGPAFTITKTTY